MATSERLIMHVDDDPMMTALVAKKLSARGYSMLPISDPTTALGTLLETNCRVVLLDIDMPGTNGVELLRAIKQQDGGVQVIMLTGLVSMRTVLQSMRWGAEACLFKPLKDFTELEARIEAAFVKIDCWWNSLQELKQLKVAESRVEATSDQ